MIEAFSYQSLSIQERTFSREMEVEKKLKQYDPDFDTHNYLKLHTQPFQSLEVYQKQREALDTYTRMNLQTMLGERFNVLLSTRRDEIQDDKLYASYSQKPLAEIFKKGVEHRRQAGSSPTDQVREQGELDSFEKIQQVLCDTETPIGTMMVHISPPGKSDTEYKHNFYDIFTLQKDGEKRYVDYRRYTSALSLSETFTKVRTIDPFYATDRNTSTPDDLYYIKHPIIVDPRVHAITTADSLHQYFHKGHQFLTREQFALVLENSQGYIDAYMQAIAKMPPDIQFRNLTYNALLNKAESIAWQLEDLAKTGIIIADTQTIIFSREIPTKEDIFRYGMMPVVEKMTGCGSSGGMSLSEIIHTNPIQDMARSSFSIADIGIMLELSSDVSYSFDKEGSCVSCGKKNSQVGPCGICEPCDRSIRRQQGQQVPLQMK